MISLKMPKAQKVKVVEGFNFEVKTGKGQYKFREGSYAMEGSDIARRWSLMNCIENGVPADLEEVTLEKFNLIVQMQLIADRFFEEQSGIPSRI